MSWYGSDQGKKETLDEFSENELSAGGSRCGSQRTLWTSCSEPIFVFVYRAGARPREVLPRRRRKGMSIRLTSSIEKASGS